MENLCAIIDAQGFFFDGEFVIRELAIGRLSDNYVRSWDVETPVKEETMIIKDRITNSFVRQHHNGLDYNPPSNEKPIVFNKIKPFIAFLYRHCRSLGYEKFGIKNHQLGNILDDLRIPYVKLDTPTYPTLMRYYQKTVFCDRHIYKPDGVCAVQKVEHMKNYLIDKNNFENIYKHS